MGDRCICQHRQAIAISPVASPGKTLTTEWPACREANILTLNFTSQRQEDSDLGAELVNNEFQRGKYCL